MRSRAFRTVRYEPRYTLLALAAGGALGWAVSVRESGFLLQLGV